MGLVAVGLRRRAVTHFYSFSFSIDSESLVTLRQFQMNIRIHRIDHFDVE